MKVFEVQKNLTSYWYPVMKIIICAVVIGLGIFRRKLLTIPYQWMNIIVSLVSFVLAIICILILYISIGEVFHTYANRNRPRYDFCNAAKYSVYDVISMAQSEDIIEIDLLTKEGLIKVGTSSDNRYVSPTFVDKQYYIGEHTYKGISEFASELMSISSDNVLYILSIDGISIK